MLGDQALNRRGVADVALDQLCLGRNRPSEAGDQIVEDDDLLPASRRVQTIWLPM